MSQPQRTERRQFGPGLSPLVISLRERLADLWLGFRPDTVRGWLEKLNFTITGADVVGEPDSLKLITFRGQKQWPKSQIRQKRGRARKKTTK